MLLLLKCTQWRKGNIASGRIRQMRCAPAEFLKPRSLQPENEIEVKILQRGMLINLINWFICHSTLWGSFQIEAPMDCIVGAEKIPHYNKANLFFMVTNVERFSCINLLWVSDQFHSHWMQLTFFWIAAPVSLTECRPKNLVIRVFSEARTCL